MTRVGIRQLFDDTVATIVEEVQAGDVVTCVVSAARANGLEVRVNTLLAGFIGRRELSIYQNAQRPDRFFVGQKIAARIITIDRCSRKLMLTLRSNEVVDTLRGRRLPLRPE